MEHFLLKINFSSIHFKGERGDVMIKRPARVVWILTSLFLLIQSCCPITASNLQEEQILHYRRITRIQNQGVETAFDLVLTLLLFPPVELGNQQTFEERITPEPIEITKDDNGNRYARIQISRLQPGEIIDVVYETNLSNQYWMADKSTLWSLSQQLQLVGMEDQPWGVNFSDSEWVPYLKDEPYISVDHSGIQELARTLTADAEGIYDKAQSIFDYVNTNMNYDESPLFARKGSVSALYNLKGICTDFASLMIALLRASNIPARMVGGYLFDEVARESGQQYWNGSKLAHAWVEFYLPGFGWIPADPTHVYYLNDIRVPARQSFAAIPNWGHVVSSYGVEAVTYTLQGNHYGGAILSVSGSDQFFSEHRKLSEEIYVYINQNQRAYFSDAKPKISEQGRTLVPLRAIFQALGATVLWDPLQQTITAVRKGTEIIMKIDEPTIWVDSIAYALDTAPYIEPDNWRTMIPLRAVSEAFGASVEWVEATKDIMIVLHN